MSDDKPPEKPTVEIEKPPAWAIGLSESMQRGFNELRANIELVADDVKLTKERIGLVEQRTKQLEERADKSSLRARGPSEVDIEHAAQLAQEKAAREELAAKVDALAGVNERQLALLEEGRDAAKKILAKPAVRTLAIVLWTAFLAWAARHGLEVPR